LELLLSWLSEGSFPTDSQIWIIFRSTWLVVQDGPVAATIVTIVQLTDTILATCYAYTGKVKNAAAGVDKVIQELSVIKGIVLNLHGLAKQKASAENLTSLCGPNSPVSVCLTALQEINDKLEKIAKSHSARQKLLWPFES
jgi:hypothetical protein